jgi:hypothetical protein
MQEQQLSGVVWGMLMARAEELRQLDAAPRVLRQAITMRSTGGRLFGSPIDQLVGFLGMLSSPHKPRKTRGGSAEADRIAV